MLDASAPLARLLEDLEHRHRAAAARRLALRDHDLRLARLEPLRHGRRREAGEDRHLDRAQVCARVRGDRDLGRHRQEDRDAVAGPDAERRELLGEPRRRRARAPRRSARGARRPRRARPRRRRRACARPSGARSCSAIESGRRRTTSPTRARATGRRPASHGARSRGRGRRRRAARTTRARRTSGARAPRSRPPGAPLEAGHVGVLDGLRVGRQTISAAVTARSLRTAQLVSVC